MDDITFSTEPKLYRFVKFILFILLQILSSILSVYILYKLLLNRQFRKRLINHSIILLIIISFIDVTCELSITLDYLYYGYIRIRQTNFCLFWIWFNFSLQTTNLYLMTWTSIERHLFIFNSNLIQTQSGKYKWHFIPLSFCIIYVFTFYTICIFIYSCKNQFDYSSYLCGTICYNNLKCLSTFDWLTNILIPSLIIPISSITLLIRVVTQSKKMKRIFKWKSARKMTIQLLIISILYLLFWFPLSLISLIRIYFYPALLDNFTYYYLYYTPYFVQLFIPFVSFVSLPELWKRKNRVHAGTL